MRMSDGEEDVVEAMGAQRVQTHQLGVQSRRQMEDPTELLIASGCVRVDETEVDNAARKCKLVVRQFLARKHFIEQRYNVVLCQTRGRQCLAQKYAQTQRFCKDDEGAALIVAKVTKCQAVARGWIARHLARKCAAKELAAPVPAQ